MSSSLAFAPPQVSHHHHHPLIPHYSAAQRSGGGGGGGGGMGVANIQDWLKAWKSWAATRKRGKMAQFIVQKLEENVSSCP